MEPVPDAIEIFFSYAHEDEKLRDKLEQHLTPLMREGKITNWYDRKIIAGKNLTHEIDIHLNTAQIILLLISASFMHSDYCYGIEIKRAMERHTEGEARVIPVILRPVYWRGAPFGRLQALPTGAKPVVEWSIQDKAFENITQGIRKVVEELGTKHIATPTFPISQKDSTVVYVAKDIQKAVEELYVKDTGSLPSPTHQKDSTATDIIKRAPKASQDTLAEDIATLLLPSGDIVHKNRGSTMTDLIGQLLGNYRLTRLIGEGGFADVYLGEHVLLGRKAAIKVLRTRLTENDAHQFQQEAKFIASLDHPNIVKVLEFGFADNTPFLVMDFAPYGSLRYPKGTRLPPTTIIPRVKQVADALQYAHDQKLIHRDVKPENMLVGRNNEVLLSDFGIAIVESTRSQRTQDTAGTIAYTAPEQLDGHPRQASDQYALGIVVYEWLSGECPFKGSFTEIAGQHMLTPPPPLYERIPGVSSGIEQVVMKALAKKPEERYSNVQEFASALEKAIFSPPPLDTHESNTSRRNFVLAAIGGFLVGGAGGFLTDRLIPPSSPQITSITPTPTQTPPPYVYFGHFGEVNTVDWSPNGKSIVSGGRDNTARIWDVATGKNLFTYNNYVDWVLAVAWSPNGKRIASGSADKTVRVWNAADGGYVYTYQGHSTWVNAVAWSLDSKLIASGSSDQTVQVWDAGTGGPITIYRGHSASVHALAWSPSNKLIASGGGEPDQQNTDTTVQIWDAVTGTHILTYTGHSAQVDGLAWSPDGTRIASSSFDKTVQVWDTATGGHTFALSYKRHTDIVRAVAWSPDGKFIASASADRTVQVWDANTGNTIFTYPGHHNWVHAVKWSPDGKLIASASADQTVQVWQVPL